MYPVDHSHCTVADGATGAPVEEVQENCARVGSVSDFQVGFPPAQVFQVHTKNLSFSGGLVMEIFDFFDSKTIQK